MFAVFAATARGGYNEEIHSHIDENLVGGITTSGASELQTCLHPEVKGRNATDKSSTRGQVYGRRQRCVHCWSHSNTEAQNTSLSCVEMQNKLGKHTNVVLSFLEETVA